jgi:hypothetical protein
MTVEDGDMTFAVPDGGSMTFIEGGNAWTFADVANTAQAFTTSKHNEAIDLLTTYVDQNINDTVVCLVSVPTVL